MLGFSAISARPIDALKLPSAVEPLSGVYVGIRVVAKSLIGAGVDTVTLTGSGRSQLHNRGAGIIWFRSGRNAAAIIDPIVAGDESMPVLSGDRELMPGGHSVVKITGDGDAYTVIRI